MTNMDFGDWLVFISIILAFAILIAITIYFITVTTTQKAKIDRLTTENAQLYKHTEFQADYIQKRDNQGWNYVHGSGSGKSESVLEDDHRGRHHRPTGSDNPQTVVLSVRDGNDDTVVRRD